MKITTLTVFLFVSFTIFSQSKKEQLEIYKSKVDSLTNSSILKSIKIDSLASVCYLKTELVDSCKKQLNRLNQLITEKEASFKEKNEKLTIENKQLELKNSKLSDSIIKQSLTITTAKINVFEINDFVNKNYEFIFVDDEEVSYPDNLNLNGQFTSFYPKGFYEDANSNDQKQLIYATGAYKDGFKEGVWKYYLCDGTIQYEGTYKKGIRIGKWTNFDFCNQVIYYSKDQVDFISLFTLIDYYKLDIDLHKELSIFKNGMISDTLYYFDELNILKLKLALKDGSVYYDNNQPLVNQKCRFENPYFVGLENNNITIFNRNGKVHYKLAKNGNQITEEFFNENGMISEKALYVNGVGKIMRFDLNGKLEEEIENEFGTGMFGGECPCQ
jgi:antitoxin component YwqK of YwqJK toxin-antitoxin module